MQRSTTAFFLFLFHRSTIKYNVVTAGAAIFCLACLPAFLHAQDGAVLVGTVKDKITQELLVGVAVTADSAGGAVTDVEGRFRIAGLPPRSYNITATYLGYAPQTRYNVVLTTGNDATLNFELEPAGEELGEVVVSENRSVRIATIETPLSVQNVSTEEIKANPGGNFDISRVVQSLPGVGGTAGSVGGFRNDLIVRGGGPSENVYYLDGIEIPVINHFTTQGAAGGPTGMLNVSFIEDATLSASAFAARYDNALSSVLQFRQRDGNPDRVQGNFRLSGTEAALTGEGPLGRRGGPTTFLASVRRSYLQLLFGVLGLPIRPNYWDFQYKVVHRFDARTTLSALGIGAIDEFSFAAPKDATPENLYVLNAVPGINQWNYTQGFTFKRLIDNGFWNVSVSRTAFENRLDQFEDNYNGDQADEARRTLGLRSRETENKLRFEYNRFAGAWKFSFGAVAQYVDYFNNTFNRLRPELRDSSGAVVQPAVTVNFRSEIDFFKYGAFAQLNRTFFGERLGLSVGVRADGNSFTQTGDEPWRTLSPRASVSYALAPRWKASASVGRYYKLPLYTALGFRDEQGALVNRELPYTAVDHYVGGLEFIPAPALRFTLEGFYKQYDDYLVSRRTGLSLANQGGDFGIIGNEALTAAGTGEAYGVELFAQQKLTGRLFYVASYTLFWSRFSNLGGLQDLRGLTPSAWDNRHLFSATMGYKFPRNWELGVKYRFQGGVPFTPFDEAASRQNYLVTGRGTPDYARFNAERLGAFNQLDLRIDKKWNFRRATFDLFLDVTNVLLAANPAYPNYTFKRNADNTGFETADGAPLRADGSNAIPVILDNDDPSVVPTIGFIFEF